MAKTDKKKVRRKRPQKGRKRGQRGGKLDIQKLIEKKGKEFHWPNMNYTGPGTHLEKRLRRGDRGVNRLVEIARIHDIDYSKAKNLQDKWKADDKNLCYYEPPRQENQTRTGRQNHYASKTQT